MPLSIDSKVKTLRRLVVLHRYFSPSSLHLSSWLRLEKTHLAIFHKSKQVYRTEPIPRTNRSHPSIIFGNDRATGDTADSAADIAEALDDEDVAANETGDGSTTVLGSTPQEPAKKKAKISENIIAGLGDFADKFGVFFERTNVKLEIIGNRMGYAHDLSVKRATVNEALRKLPITTEDRVKVGMTIPQDAQKVDYFFSLDDEEEKMIMVHKLLSSNI